MGIVTSIFISGMLATSTYGWPIIFYLFNAIGLVWCVLFAIYGCNTPRKHKMITEEECNYICSNTGITGDKKVTYC